MNPAPPVIRMCLLIATAGGEQKPCHSDARRASPRAEMSRQLPVIAGFPSGTLAAAPRDPAGSPEIVSGKTKSARAVSLRAPFDETQRVADERSLATAGRQTAMRCGGPR